MNRGGERRCVGIVQTVERFQRHARGNTRYGDVNHFIDGAAQHLDAQKLMRRTISDQFCHKEGRTWIIMSFIIAGADHRDRFIAGFAGLCFRQTGAAGVKAFA